MAAKDDYLLDSLVDMGWVMSDDVDSARQQADDSGEGVVDTLIANGLLTPEGVAQAKAAQFGAEFVNLGEMQLEDDVINSMRRDIVKKYKAIPVFNSDESITIAVVDPSDIDAIDSLNHILNKHINLMVAAESDIDEAIDRYYGGGGGGGDEDKSDDVGKMIQDITEGEVQISTLGNVDTGDGGEEIDADAPIIKLVNTLIVDAFKLRASDIHLEPLEKTFRVRYRIDGVCQVMKPPPKRLQGSIIARLKIMANMSIAEKRIPQDGRIQANVGGKTIDLRVNCLPTNHGESIVMRILDKEGVKLGLGQLGFFSDDQQTFERMIGLPDGILLVTGPTGSGKTTTLYSCLNYINRPDRKIITVEDPVEYQLDGINQVQVHANIGFTFALALRAMLRQSPNIIMLGEIRDKETATIAINASLTGHLVFSTLHTNDAPSAVARLTDIGVKPFLVASATRVIMAQRLVRSICGKCAQPYEPTDAELHSLGLERSAIEEMAAKKGAGCSNCNKTGYRGRKGIFEIFVLNDEARKLAYDGVPASVMRNKARELGMRTLREDGARKVVAGVTSTEEVMRVTSKDTD